MKNQRIWIGVVIVIVIIVIVAIFATGHHKSTSTNSTSGTSTTSSPASSDILQTLTDSNGKQYLADSAGRPLYTYGADTSGKSNCTGSCLASWPVYSAANAPASLPSGVSVITRSDGSKQYAYNGMPLYTFTGDSAKNPTGDSVNNFHLATPAASNSGAQTPSSAPATSSPSSSGGYNY